MADYLITGVGGQGIVLSSRLLAQAAIAQDLEVRTAETIGMSQRGGQVSSHVRFGEKVHSPLIGKGQADLLLAFEPAEAVRSLDLLKPDAAILCLTSPVWPVTTSLKGQRYEPQKILDTLLHHKGPVVLCDPEPLSQALGSRRFINVALLGTAQRAGFLAFSAQDLQDAVTLLVKPKYVEVNQEALRRGLEVTRKND